MGYNKDWHNIGGQPRGILVSFPQRIRIHDLTGMPFQLISQCFPFSSRKSLLPSGFCTSFPFCLEYFSLNCLHISSFRVKIKCQFLREVFSDCPIQSQSLTEYLEYHLVISFRARSTNPNYQYYYFKSIRSRTTYVTQPCTSRICVCSVCGMAGAW